MAIVYRAERCFYIFVLQGHLKESLFLYIVAAPLANLH